MQAASLGRWMCFISFTVHVGSVARATTDPSHLQYQIEYFPEMSDQDFGRLQDLIHGRPEHPDRIIFETEHRRRTNGPDIVVHDLWMDHKGIRRFNTSNTSDSMFSDIAIGDRVAWALSQHQLTLLPINGSSHPEAPQSLLLLEQAQSTVDILNSCGRSIRELVPVGAWVHAEPGAMTASGDNMTIQYTATKNGTSTVTITASPSMPEIVGQRWELSDPDGSRASPSPACKVLSEFSSAGQLLRRTTVLRSEPIDRHDLDLLTKTPSLSGSDPVRGSYTYKAIYDFSKNDPSVTVLAESGHTTMDLSQTPMNLARSRMRMVGWFTAAVVAGLIISLRIRNQKGISS